MGELLKGKSGTKYYNPPKAVPILGLASDGHQTFLTAGGGGSTASKEVPNQVQVHRVDETGGKLSVTTTCTLNTEKSVVVYLSYVAASGLYLACTQARCKVLELSDDGSSLKELFEWTCEDAGKKPELNVARASPSGELAATGGTDGRVRIWRFTSAPKVQEAPTLQHACAAKKGEVESLDFSPDEKTIASCGSGPCLLWDVATGEERTTIKYEKSGKMLTVKAARFITHAERASPVLVLAANSGPRHPSYVALFGIDGSKIIEVGMEKVPVTAMGLDERGQCAVITLVSGTKKVFSLPGLQLLVGVSAVHDLPAPGTAVVGELALSGGGDRTVHLLKFSRSGGGSSALVYMCVLLTIILAIVYLTLQIGIKGAALQQGSRGGEL